MGFQPEVLEAWQTMLEDMQDDCLAPTGATSLRFPVTRAGADQSQTGFPTAANYDCLPSPSLNQVDLITGGFVGAYEFSISVRKADCSFFTDPRMNGILILKGGRVSRVLWPEISELSPLVVLHCGSPDK